MLRKNVNLALVDYLCQRVYALNTLYGVKHQKILPRSNTQLYYNNGGHNNNLKTLRRFHDVDDVTVKDNQ